MDLFGKDFIVSQDWDLDELMALLDLAAKMKRDRYGDRPRFACTCGSRRRQEERG